MSDYCDADGFNAAPLADTGEAPNVERRDAQLSALAKLASIDIESSMINDIGASLHSLFDDVCDKALPIYFGPLLGRLYLEGL